MNSWKNSRNENHKLKTCFFIFPWTGGQIGMVKTQSIYGPVSRVAICVCVYVYVCICMCMCMCMCMCVYMLLRSTTQYYVVLRSNSTSTT